MPESINIAQLLELRKTLPVIDVRSEGEYEHAHIPGAKNLSLLNNEERAKVGTCFKQKGREEAILLGFDLVGNKFSNYIRTAKEIIKHPSQPSPQGRALPTHNLLDGKRDGNSPPVGELEGVVLYCWRGGLRSNIMAWVLETGGMKVFVLEGGYKTFRHWALDEFEKEREILILGGKTGSGKTDILKEMKSCNEQVIDLEALAHHRGSAFGALGQLPQPSTEQFENLVALELNETDKTKALWLENESSKIGTVKIPDALFNKMRKAKVFEIEMSLEQRTENILRDYATFPKEKLAECTKKIEKKLGNKNMKDALRFLDEDDFTNWIKILLDYYDKTYSFSKSQRTEGTVSTIDISVNTNAAIAAMVIEYSKQKH